MHRAIALRAVHARPVQTHRNASLDAFRYARAYERQREREKDREYHRIADPFAFCIESVCAKTGRDRNGTYAARRIIVMMMMIGLYVLSARPLIPVRCIRRDEEPNVQLIRCRVSRSSLWRRWKEESIAMFFCLAIFLNHPPAYKKFDLSGIT